VVAGAEQDRRAGQVDVPGLLEVDDRGDLSAGTQDVGGAEIEMDELSRQPVGWRAGDQPAQRVASRRRQMLGASVEPAGQPVTRSVNGLDATASAGIRSACGYAASASCNRASTAPAART
jgi:hypothetical protein